MPRTNFSGFGCLRTNQHLAPLSHGPGSSTRSSGVRWPEISTNYSLPPPARCSQGFELGDGAEHLQREHPPGYGGVDPVAQAPEVGATCLELLDHRQKMADGSRQPIEAYYHQCFARGIFAQQPGQHGAAAICP